MKNFISNQKSDINLITHISLSTLFILFLFIISSNAYGGYYERQEFQINTYTADGQQSPSVTALLGDNNFVVVWVSNSGQDGDGFGIYGQIFDGSGSKIGSEFQVNTYTAGNQNLPSVVGLSNGNFVVVWSGEGTGSVVAVYGQIFNGAGSKIDDEFLVNTSPTINPGNPSVTALSSGFAATWHSATDGSGNGIYGQIFDAAGSKINSEIPVNNYTSNSQQLGFSDPITTLISGYFVVVWYGAGTGDSYGIYGQIFNNSGTKVGDEFLINTHTNSDQACPSVAGLSNGNFVVTWESDGQDGNSYGIYGQILDGSGTKVGSEFPINTHTALAQMRSSVAALNNGDFVVTWSSNGQDGDDYGIYGQIFNSSGTKTGNEFLVNTHTDSYQNTPSVTILNDGSFVVVWNSNNQDGDGLGIYGKIFEYADNTAPTIKEITKSGTKNSVLYFKKTDFTNVFEDGDGDSITHAQITSLPNNGLLKLINSGPVAIDQDISIDDITNNFVFDPNKEWTGTTSFGWRGYDGFEYSNAKKIVIKIDPAWLETWRPFIIGGIVAAVGVPSTIISTVAGGLMLKKCKQYCFKNDAKNIELGKKDSDSDSD